MWKRRVNAKHLPFMLGSGFLTTTMGEPPVPAGCPARPAGLGDPEVVRPGDSYSTATNTRLWRKYIFFNLNLKQYNDEHSLSLLSLAWLAALPTKTVERKKKTWCVFVWDSFYIYKRSVQRRTGNRLANLKTDALQMCFFHSGNNTLIFIF